MPILGCIADDFTGASDAASFLVKGGMNVRLYNGIPNAEESLEKEEVHSVHAIVIALKSRTQDREAAVADSLSAARFLKKQGVRQLYFKYCSTFDSTPEGNIGPVADALLDFAGAPYTLLCPSLPVNGRTVEDGCLLVNGVPLHESHMKDHPLTPMWDCRIEKLMECQSRYGSYVLNQDEIEKFTGKEEMKTPFYLIPDYRKDEDGERLAMVFGELPLLTGGSGLLEHLARQWMKKMQEKASFPESRTQGAALLLAGSCSKATLEQIAWYKGQGAPCYKLDPAALLIGKQTLDMVWDYVQKQERKGAAVLVYSSDESEQIKRYQKLGASRVAALLEETMAHLAVRALENGYTRIICAGGETSGAVTKALGFSSYWIGKSVAPGVPIMVPTQRSDVRLVLKSGNFGQENFFGRALELTAGKISHIPVI